MDELMEMLDYYIYHFDEIDVSDLVHFQKELNSWYHHQSQLNQKMEQQQKELDKIKQRYFNKMTFYDPDYVMKKLDLTTLDFIKRKEGRSFTKEEIEKVFR